MKIDIKAMVLTCSLLGGAIMLVLNVITTFYPGYAFEFLSTASSIYPGYYPGGFVGVLLGTFYGFVDGAILGLVFGLLYNKFAKK